MLLNILLVRATLKINIFLACMHFIKDLSSTRLEIPRTQRVRWKENFRKRKKIPRIPVGRWKGKRRARFWQKFGLALGRPAAARKPLRTVESTPPHFLASFLPLFPLPPSVLHLSLPCCFFHRRRRRRRRRRSLAERASFRESVARFSLAHGVTDKRAGEGTIKRDGNCTGCSSLTRTTVIQDKINRGKRYIYVRIVIRDNCK